MAWERRRKGWFYYRSYRDPTTGQVRKQYSALAQARRTSRQRAAGSEKAAAQARNWTCSGVMKRRRECYCMSRGMRNCRQGRAGGGRLLPTQPRRMETLCQKPRQVKRIRDQRAKGPGKSLWATPQRTSRADRGPRRRSRKPPPARTGRPISIGCVCRPIRATVWHKLLCSTTSISTPNSGKRWGILPGLLRPPWLPKSPTGTG